MEIIKMATYTINLPDLHKITVFTDQWGQHHESIGEHPCPHPRDWQTQITNWRALNDVAHVRCQEGRLIGGNNSFVLCRLCDKACPDGTCIRPWPMSGFNSSTPINPWKS
jgi:NAD-dependent dihydropyrimidine dehydrogenase PreA subunit